jgi:hypothetical protein
MFRAVGDDSGVVCQRICVTRDRIYLSLSLSLCVLAIGIFPRLADQTYATYIRNRNFGVVSPTPERRLPSSTTSLD